MSEFTLTINADIICPINIYPKNIYFIGKKNDLLKSEIKIEANLNKPLIIEPVSFDLEDKVKYEIKEIRKKKIYKINFIKFPSNDTNINGTLKIKTNYTEMPYIYIKVKGYFRAK